MLSNFRLSRPGKNPPIKAEIESSCILLYSKLKRYLNVGFRDLYSPHQRVTQQNERSTYRQRAPKEQHYS